MWGSVTLIILHERTQGGQFHGQSFDWELVNENFPPVIGFHINFILSSFPSFLLPCSSVPTFLVNIPSSPIFPSHLLFLSPCPSTSNQSFIHSSHGDVQTKRVRKREEEKGKIKEGREVESIQTKTQLMADKCRRRLNPVSHERYLLFVSCR